MLEELVFEAPTLGELIPVVRGLVPKALTLGVEALTLPEFTPELLTYPGNPGPKKKRRTMSRRQNHLTGGTADINPQFFCGRQSMAPGITRQTGQLASPAARGIFATKNRATVMEVLKVFFYLPSFEGPTSALKNQFRRVNIGTKDYGVGSYDGGEPSIFASYEDQCVSTHTAPSNLGYYYPNTIQMDLTDCFGHGLLVGTDVIYFQTEQAVMILETKWAFKILYRFKNVGITEYIGIVQSQT